MTNTTKKVIVGVLSTVVATVAVYFLVSPKQCDNRKKIADNLGDIASHIGGYFTTAKEKMQTT
ncbi:MAG: hypothetical protein ABJB11_03215 [Ferruginibacter sp.]